MAIGLKLHLPSGLNDVGSNELPSLTSFVANNSTDSDSLRNFVLNGGTITLDKINQDRISQTREEARKLFGSRVKITEVEIRKTA